MYDRGALPDPPEAPNQGDPIQRKPLNAPQPQEPTVTTDASRGNTHQQSPKTPSTSNPATTTTSANDPDELWVMILNQAKAIDSITAGK